MTLTIALTLILSPVKSYAWTDGSGWANFGYLVKILSENLRRYKQLRLMIDQAKDQKRFLKTLHSGLANSVGLLEGLPIKDNEILKELKSFTDATEKINKLYGTIPKSKDQAMHKLHDQTIAESLKMVNAFKDYVKIQERNASQLQNQARSASPTGATRMAAESQAIIMRSLAQLIRLQNQSLKMQSEQFALINKTGKVDARNFAKVQKDIGAGFSSFKMSKTFSRF